MTRALWMAALLAGLAGCATPLEGLFQPGPGRAALGAGLRQYDDGQYADAAKNLQAAIDQGLTEPDRANAHKHLAFIHCTSNRERACREEFRKAVTVQPSLDLTPAESGHPVWGPIFRSVRAESAATVSKAEPALTTGLRQYEDGDYDESLKTLQTAIDQGLPPRDRANAHKHLAFIHCASQRERQCREEFRKALASNPNLALAPAEAGHPVWGPIFRAVKAGR